MKDNEPIIDKNTGKMVMYFTSPQPGSAVQHYAPDPVLGLMSDRRIDLHRFRL